MKADTINYCSGFPKTVYEKVDASDNRYFETGVTVVKR